MFLSSCHMIILKSRDRPMAKRFPLPSPTEDNTEDRLEPNNFSYPGSPPSPGNARGSLDYGDRKATGCRFTELDMCGEDFLKTGGTFCVGPHPGPFVRIAHSRPQSISAFLLHSPVISNRTFGQR